MKYKNESKVVISISRNDEEKEHKKEMVTDMR